MRNVGKRSWGRVVSIGSVVALVLGLTVVAYASPGLPIAKVDLNDSGVWVTNQSATAVGRFNASAKALDAGVDASPFKDFDVLQNDGNVFIRDLTGGGFLQVQPSTATTSGSQVKLPANAQMKLGGGVVAILDAAAGDLWVMPATSAGGFTSDAATNPPTVEKVAGNSLVTVGTDGTAYLLNPGASTITTFPADPVVKGKTLRLSGLSTDDSYALTVVGTTPVTLDRTNHTLYLGSSRPINLDLTAAQASSLQLQDPSDGANDVAYETDLGLVSQPLNGKTSSQVSVPGGGTPSQPVQLDGCTYAVWSVNGAYVRQCAGDTNVAASTVPNFSTSDTLQFRTNRGFIVLNSIQDGSVWQAGDQLVPANTDWASVLTAAQAQNTDTATQSDQQIDQSSKPDLNQADTPPTAQDDTFGVRAGRSTLLPVLENDVSPDGLMLTAALVSPPPSIGTLSLVYSNSVFQIDVPDGATGSTAFQYQAADGRGGVSNTANVTVNIVPSDVNNPPVQLRATSLQVTAGQSVTYNILADWRDPDGDTIYLQDATPDSPDDSVQFMADGSMTFTDGGKATGSKKIAVTVSDGQATTTGEVDVTVYPGGAGSARPPVTVNDMASTTVDQPIVIHPLDNDSDPNGLPINLTSVTDADNCVITPDMLANTVTATCSTVGSYYLVYTISDGKSTNVYGLIRLDVLAAPTGDEPPVAVPDTVLLHMGQTTTVNALNNDVNPMGWPLVLTSVTVPSGAPVQAAVINHQAVLVTPLQDFADPVTLTYQISNGIGYSESTMTLIPVPVPAQIAPPITRDSTVNVRVGDVATADVLANDSQPDGVPLELLPDLVQVPDSSTGIKVFTSGKVVRVQAGQVPGTFTVLYQVGVASGSAEPATGRLTVTVTPADDAHNQAPQPQDIQARTLAGQPVTIPIPLTGIDPDGDSCTLVGVASAPSQGVISAVSGNSITYDPTSSVTGSATFTYTVQDRLGAQATGKITVGIAPVQGTNDPPVAMTDSVQARPGRSMSVAVLANDYDPAGNSFTLVDGSAQSNSFTATTTNQHVNFTAPTAEGTYLATYQIEDSLGQTSTGIISVQVSATAPLLLPNPQDDYVPMAAGLTNTPVTVDVLVNDNDPSGDVSQDTMALDDTTNATIVGGKVQVTLVSQPQVIGYTLTNTQDNLVGRAYIWAPGLDTTPPQLKTGVQELQVESGASIDLQLSDYVQVRSGRSPRITSADKVTAWNGTGTADSTTQLTFAAPPGYVGPASISFEVTDGATLNDNTGLASTLTVPITVIPSTQKPPPPTFANSAVKVEAGGTAAVDLGKFATGAVGSTATLTFAVSTPPTLAGVKVAVTGSTLTVTADPTAVVGSSDTVGVSVSDGTNAAVDAQVGITVVDSTKPLPQALTDNANAKAGQTVAVNATANDFNPFDASQPLTIVSVSVANADSGTAVVGCPGDATGCVSITPAATFIGQMTVTYVIQDATKQVSRQASGQILVTVKGPPTAPTAPHIDSIGNQQVVLSWQPPSNDGGTPITGYTVTGSPSYTKDCGTSTICTLDGLTNTVTYTFTVTATNAVGTSPASVASAPATPDAVPDVMNPPTVQFGNQQLTYTWANAVTTGRSAVQSYQLQLSPAPPNGQSMVTGIKGNSFTWTGLTNGTAYQVKICAVNNAPQSCSQASMWSAASSPETPSAPPDPPAAPGVTLLPDFTGSSGQVKVCWNAPATNGAAITGYAVTSSSPAVNGSSSFAVAPSGSAQTCTTIEMANSANSVTFTVQATNRAGTGAASTASNPMQVFGTPGPPGSVSLADGDNSCSASFAAASLNGASASQVTYQYQASNGVTGSFGTNTGGNVTGLPNNGPYTVTVWAVSTVQGTSIAGPKVTSNTCTPFGKPNQPGLSVSVSGDTISWSTSAPGPNGRAIASVQTSTDNSNWGSSSGSSQVGYNKSVTVYARACDTTGACSTSVSKTVTTGAAPPPPPTCSWTHTSTTLTTTYYNISGSQTVYWSSSDPNAGSWRNGTNGTVSGNGTNEITDFKTTTNWQYITVTVGSLVCTGNP